MDINEFVSIIVPIYKIQYNLLRDTITSLINQTYNNVEIILVDDGSPDGIVVRVVGLDNHIAGQLSSAGAPCRLGQQSKGALRRMKIIHMQ